MQDNPRWQANTRNLSCPFSLHRVLRWANPPDLQLLAMNENRRIRVFVSSTFRDLVEDRNELMTHAWPELRRFCRERQVELVEVDLRWGITEEQSTRKETLKLCLDEIRSCRPFFIGLLGERYGWVPGDDAFTADLSEEQPWLRGLSGKSVTELEILHGVLNNPEMAGRSFFYFRDPAYAQARGVDFLSEDSASQDKQEALKELIKKTCAQKQIPLNENYPDPQALAKLVLKDLKDAIEAQFPIEEVPDPLTKEARDHEAFAETRRRTYIGRPEYFARLDGHAVGDGVPLVLLGESGSGKSALLANWIEHWRTAHPEDFLFQHYIGGTPDSADHWRLMTRLIAEIKRWSEGPGEVPRSHDDLLRDFGLWLAKARARAEHLGVRVIVILDALNQLQDDDHARLLGWLPEHPFTGPLRLVVSTLPVRPPVDDPEKIVDDPLKVVADRGWKTMRVEPLTTEERRGMMAHYLARFGKKLDEARLERLATAPAASNPLYLKILLDELRVTGTHNRLDERLAEYLRAPDIAGLLGLVLDRYQRDYERDCPGLVGEALGLIWAARRGLSEIELLRLLRPPDLPQLPAAIWSPFRAALDESLVDRGGILNFAHDFLRLAVEQIFIPGGDYRGRLRLKLARDFERQSITARTCDELPWLLLQCCEYDKLQACLLNLARFSKIHERDSNELMHDWQIIISNHKKNTGSSLDVGRLYLAQLEQTPDSEKIYVVGTLGQFLYELGFFDAALSCFEDQDATVQRLNLPFEDRMLSIVFLTAVTANDKGLIERDIGRQENALRCFTEAADLVETYLSHLGTAGQPRNDAKRLLSAILMNQASVLRSDIDKSRCGDLLEKALVLMKEAKGETSPEVATVLQGVGNFNMANGEFESALRHHLDALSIRRMILGNGHRDVGLSMGNVATSLAGTHHYHFAMELWERSLQILSGTIGDEHQSSKSVWTSLAECKELVHRSMTTPSQFGVLLLACETQWPKENPPEVVTQAGVSTVATGISDLLTEIWDESVAYGSCLPVLLLACPGYEKAVIQVLQTRIAAKFPKEIFRSFNIPSILAGLNAVDAMVPLVTIPNQITQWLQERNIDVLMVRPIADSGAITDRRFFNFVRNSYKEEPKRGLGAFFQNRKNSDGDFRPIALECVPWDNFDGPLLGLFSGDSDPRPALFTTRGVLEQGYSPTQRDLRSTGAFYVNIPAMRTWFSQGTAREQSNFRDWSAQSLISFATEPVSEQCSVFESSLSDLILTIKARPINMPPERGTRSIAMNKLNREIDSILGAGAVP